MELSLSNTFYLQWLQLADAIPKPWANIVENNTDNNGPLTGKDRPIIQNNRIILINKLNAERHNLLFILTFVSNAENSATSQILKSHFLKNL